MKEPRSLTASQLAFLDTMITRAQERGHSPSDVLTPPNETVGLADAHHPLFEITERDRRIIGQIAELASQLEFSTTLGKLIELRTQASAVGVVSE